LKKGLEAVRKENFDLLISDWRLSGDDTAARIVEAALEKGLKTVVQTSNPDYLEIDPFRDKIKVFDKLEFENLIGYVEELQRGLKER